MNRKKLGSCLAAALVTLTGATYLANPAHAAVNMNMAACSDYEWGYVDGSSSAECQSQGYRGGYAGSCNSDPTQLTYSVSCYN